MIERATFGRSDHQSTRTIFGAAALSNVSQKEADWTMEQLAAYGVNHLDTAASYGDSELRLGPWLERDRDRYFLATKTGERTYAEARAEIHRSLERLRVEQIDLLQLHNLVDADEWAIALGPGGALEAAIEAREEGLVRFIGVTGHGLEVAERHRQSLERFDFDTVMLPYNYGIMQDPTYAAHFEALVALCEERNVAVQTIKSLLRRPWGEQTQNRATWYQPLEEQDEIDQAMHWVLGRPGIFASTSGDIYLLPKVLDAASRFERRPTDDEMEQQRSRQEMAPLFPV